MDAQAFPVRTATVFHAANRAQVGRSIPVCLKAGRNTVVVDRLPSCVVAGTLRVALLGAEIPDGMSLLTVDFKVCEDLAADVKKLERRRRSKDDELAGLRRQIELLDEWSAKSAPADASAAAPGKLLETYAGRRRAIRDAMDGLEDEIEKIVDEIAKTRERAARSTGEVVSEKLRGSATIVVVSAEDVDVELDLLYVVENAQWSPVYDLRLSIAEDSARGSDKSQVVVHYQASVSQTTGEDWDNVALTLSAGKPHFGVPELRKITTAGNYVNRAYDPRFSKSYSASNRQSVGFGPDADAERLRFLRPLTTSDWTALRSRFDIAAPSTVPSGGDSTNDTMVFIAELVVKSIDLKWIVVPKEDPAAYIECKITNSTPCVLLPGPALHFVNNSFVANSTLPRVHPRESFTATFGPDASVQATFSTLFQKRVPAVNGTLTFFRRRIAVHNARPSSLPRLVVRDQVPVAPAGDEAKVAVLAPANLPVAEDSFMGVAVRDGVRARYVQKNEDERLEGVKGDGSVEWVCEGVAARGAVEVSLVWEVSAPTGYRWTMTEAEEGAPDRFVSSAGGSSGSVTSSITGLW
ncbi:hypothetical protein DFJ73DRAFT_658519 [Zopfochytrium polystomum]|nr:hypothetical protein DFJ73DRAFT_658519 [Zopfochytrium polystomum]